MPTTSTPSINMTIPNTSPSKLKTKVKGSKKIDSSPKEHASKPNVNRRSKSCIFSLRKRFPMKVNANIPTSRLTKNHKAFIKVES